MQTSEERYTEWKKIIEEQKTSGLSKAGFCKAKGIRENSFYYYLDKLNCPKTKPLSSVENFIPVEIKSPISIVTQFSELRLILKNGIECVLPESVSGKRIREVVEVLLQC